MMIIMKLCMVKYWYGIRIELSTFRLVFYSTSSGDWIFWERLLFMRLEWDSATLRRFLIGDHWGVRLCRSATIGWHLMRRELIGAR